MENADTNYTSKQRLESHFYDVELYQSDNLIKISNFIEKLLFIIHFCYYYLWRFCENVKIGLRTELWAEC